MLLESDVRKMLNELLAAEVAKIELGGSKITVKTSDDGKKVFFSTPVYFGGNYIPKSVRKCLNERVPFQSYLMSSSLEVDEENFRIYLNYSANFTAMINNVAFIHLLEDFSDLARKWREYLDERDQNDLVRIPVR